MPSNMSVDSYHPSSHITSTTHYTASQHSHSNRWSALGLLALAASQGGAYLGFGLQYALLTPFVLELGVPIRWASIIWLGGPITGMVVQPLVGRLSDGQRNESGSGFLQALSKRFGRRRPFLAFGGFMLVLAQLLVGNSADLGHLLGDSLTEESKQTLRIRAVCIFTLGFWLLDASNNTIWVVSKSLTADIVPEAQWPEAFSVSTGATGLGLALGYVLGGVHWSSRLPWLKTTACNDAGGCADLRFAFLLACVSCVLANLCTLLVGKETATLLERSQSPEPVREEGAHTPLLEGECRVWKVLRQNQALGTAYLVTLLAWLGWISLQMYQTEFVAKEVFQGSPDERSLENKAYVEGVQAASRALVINALLMTIATYAIPRAIRSMGKAKLWCLSTLFTALLLACSLAIRKDHAKFGASLWLALLGPVYGVQQTIPFLVVTEEAPKELLGELNGYLNVALCIPQLMISVLGGSLISLVGSDTLLFGVGALLDLLAAGLCLKYL